MNQLIIYDETGHILSTSAASADEQTAREEARAACGATAIGSTANIVETTGDSSRWLYGCVRAEDGVTDI